MFVRDLFASVGIAVSCASVAAQHTRPVTETLAAADLRVVAHAAVAARDCEGAEVKRALLMALRRIVDRDGDDAAATRLLLLDALLLREAKVPGDVLAPLLREPSTGVVALLLLCREPKVNEALLLDEMRRRDADDLGYRLIGDVLAEVGSSGFVAWVLEHTSFDLSIDVVSAGSQGRRWTIGFPDPERGLPEPPRGFPALPCYRLGNQAGFSEQRGAFRSVRRESSGGPRLVSVTPRAGALGYVRCTAPEHTAMVLPPDLMAAALSSPAVDLERWLGQVLGGHGFVLLQRIVYDDDEGFVRRGVGLRREHIATFDAVFDALVRRGLLASEAVPALRARVRVVVDDQRVAPARPLPTLPPEVELPPPQPDPPSPRVG